MIWKNPFLIKNNEQQISEEEYLSLFDSSVLQMIDEQNMEKVSRVLSTPGAGKTSLFRAFSPKVLNIISKKNDTNEYSEIIKQMERLGAIKDHNIILLSATLSCARNYSIIEEMFSNGKRKQVFFALLNYRIIMAFLKNLSLIYDIEINELEAVTFLHIPQEMLCEAESFENGFKVYEWACKGERELCDFLDSDRNEKLPLSFVHTTLLVIKLFEAQNILIHGEKYFLNSMLIFDDFHKLTNKQKEYITEAVFTLKSKIGIWLGQRLEGLSDNQIISLDGSVDRDYNSDIIIDNYWNDKKSAFYNMIENIANKRIKEAGLNSFNNLLDCIAGELEVKKYENTLKKHIELLKTKIFETYNEEYKYSDIVNYIEEISKSSFEKVIHYVCIKIYQNREELTFFSEEKIEVAEFKKFYDENKNSAEFYLCIKCKIPFYYGLPKLKILSSYNVEQFLFLVSDIFETCRVKALGKTNKSRKYLSAEEQEEILSKAVQKKWKDMDYRYSDIKDIKNLLNNIASIGIKSREAERNSYAGGAYTGIGIKKNELLRYLDNESYRPTYKILSACLASKYLERKDLKGDIVVFYLNRWLCLYYELPIAYGGWKPCSMSNIKEMCFNVKEHDSQLELGFYEVEYL